MKKVLFVAAEVYPFAKVGGLADVAGALPKAMEKMGVDVRVIMPYYGPVMAKAKEFGIEITDVRNVPVLMDDQVENFTLYKTDLPGSHVPVYFVQSEKYFDRDGIYNDPETKADYADQAERLVFFAKAVLMAAPALGFSPDVVHVNDHHTSLIPAYLKLSHAKHPMWKNCASVLTIHNLAYQGVFDSKALDSMEIGRDLYYPAGPFEFYGNVNFLKAGIMYVDAINTVSPTYAAEIQTPEYGADLDGVLRYVSGKLFGIINGVDYSVWDPGVDPNIEAKFSPDNVAGKAKCKAALLKEFKLPADLDKPLLGMIGRMADQKGFDLVAEILPELVKLDMRLVVLGSGQAKYEEMFSKAQADYPDRVGAYIGFDGKLAHRIEAGSDMFLMPSRFEPCGLNQMYSLRYGTAPIVRKTGGLADTVVDATENPKRGTGYVFADYSPEAFLGAIKRALEDYSKKSVWAKVVKRGMEMDYSWNTSARKYMELYDTAIKFKQVAKY